MAPTSIGSKAPQDGLQLGRSVRRTAGGGILCRHAHSLLVFIYAMALFGIGGTITNRSFY